MPVWKAYFQINGYDFSRYPEIDFPVTDDLYAQIQTALSEDRPLRECPFHRDLLSLANDALNLDDYLPDYADIFPEYAEVSVASCTIYDPGDLIRLNALLRGKRFRNFTASFDNEYNTCRYHVIVDFAPDGSIAKVRSVTSEGLVSESANSSSWESAHPDYTYITAYLLKLCEEP